MQRKDRNREISKAIFRSYFQISPIKALGLAIVVVALLAFGLAFVEPRIDHGFIDATAQSLQIAQGVYGPGQSYLTASLENGGMVTVAVALTKISQGTKICLSEQSGALTGRITYTLVPLERCADG